MIYDIDGKPPEYFYENGFAELPAWSLFSSVGLRKLNQPKTKTYKDRGGSFFNYWNNTDIDLRRYQIFTCEDNYFERRSAIEIPCVF